MSPSRRYCHVLAPIATLWNGRAMLNARQSNPTQVVPSFPREGAICRRLRCAHYTLPCKVDTLQPKVIARSVQLSLLSTLERHTCSRRLALPGKLPAVDSDIGVRPRLAPSRKANPTR